MTGRIGSPEYATTLAALRAEPLEAHPGGCNCYRCDFARAAAQWASGYTGWSASVASGRGFDVREIIAILLADAARVLANQEPS